MRETRLHELRTLLKPFLIRRNGLAVGTVVADLSIYFLAIFFAVTLQAIWSKALFAIIAGTMISTLFVLGHDAAHGSLTSIRRFNQVIARVVFLPSLHNYTLWLIQHNRVHHQHPNVKGLNSWTPYSTSEYAQMSPARRLVERVYRGGGFGLYYLIERWWKSKFIPWKSVLPEHRTAASWDLLLLAVWLGLFLGVTAWLSVQMGQTVASAIFWGFVVPFAFWNSSIGLNVFLQHTHPAVPWFETEREARLHGQEELTIHVRYPRWYGILSHNIMEHPAHHINPLIPFYNLHKAQLVLDQALRDDAVVEQMGLRYLRSLVRRCKLYDYDRQEWLDFRGRATGSDLARLHWPVPPTDTQFSPGSTQLVNQCSFKHSAEFPNETFDVRAFSLGVPSPMNEDSMPLR